MSFTQRTSALVPRSTATCVALVLSVAVILLGTVRFARLDWTGIPFDRHPLTSERKVSEECTERIRPYETDTGRVVKPIGVDEQQYMSMVDHFRGTPVEDLHVSCLIDPFASRAAVPWLAHWLPFDEGVSLALVNLSMTLLATWATVFALRAQGFSGRVVAGVGALFAVGWNTFFFSTVILVDAAVVALVAVCWYLLSIRRPWLVWPVLLVAYPFKETIPVVVLMVMAAWTWREFENRHSGWRILAPFLAAVVAALASVALSREFLLDGSATWELAPSLGVFLNNLGPVGAGSFLVATVPLFGPALLCIRRRATEVGWRPTLFDPAVVGVLVTMLLCFWTMLAADLSPRFAWVGFPFAATLAGDWFSSGRAGAWLSSRRLPTCLDRVDARAGVGPTR